MAKKKSKLKKALMAGAALAGGLALAKGRRHAGVRDSDDAGRGVNWYNHRMDNIPFADHTTVRPDFNLSFKGGGIAKRGVGAAYKKGGRVKSMGIAKRGGGVAKR
jgi:hypothetical protein